ncbi:MAG: hypothetical protein H6Q15_1260 [Bacteroidetes bacterium]|nr:hypothetical protein [Bacteroidota bacterium]
MKVINIPQRVIILIIILISSYALSAQENFTQIDSAKVTYKDYLSDTYYTYIINGEFIQIIGKERFAKQIIEDKERRLFSSYEEIKERKYRVLNKSILDSLNYILRYFLLENNEVIIKKTLTQIETDKLIINMYIYSNGNIYSKEVIKEEDESYDDKFYEMMKILDDLRKMYRDIGFAPK